MQEEEALEFYERLTSGKRQSKTVALEHKSGSTLEGVVLHVVDKKRIAQTLSELPEELFNAVDGADDPDEAEEQLEEQGGSLNSVTPETVESFENLIKDSATHPQLTKPQLDEIVDELNFEVLFSLGVQILNMSAEEAGQIRAFHERA